MGSKNQMGNNLDAYRAAIGLFHACKIVHVWYLGTNQNGIIFELLTANP